MTHPAPGAGQQEAVAYLDIGAGGYLDLGSDLSDEQLSALPKGRHMLGIIGTYGVDGYAPTSPPPTDAARVEKVEHLGNGRYRVTPKGWK